MAFPTSPSTNDEYVVNNITYSWNGTAWDIAAGIDDYITSTPIEIGENKILNIVAMTQADYDNITPVDTTMYVIIG